MKSFAESINVDGRRLWLGNLDTKITEYQLLKLVQKHGAIEKFDLLLHHTGPQAGQPRGYAFVTYVNEEDALKAKTLLNYVMVGQRRINVTWAHENKGDEVKKPKPEIKIPALAISIEEKKSDKISQIQAIEAKLKLMEQKNDELRINDTIATKPAVIHQFQYNKNRPNVTKPTMKRDHQRDRPGNNKPYGNRKKV